MSRDKRILLFAPYFLPRRRVGSMRPFRFAIHLREHGWDPTVLTIATPDQTLTKKEADLLNGVAIRTVDAPMDRTSKSESQLGAASTPRSTRDATILARLLNTIDRQFPVDTWLILFALRFRSMVRQVREVDPHVLWATGDPWSGLVVGRRLSRRLKIPYIADFRDPWTLSDVRTDGQWDLSRRVDRRSERRVIASADLVMFQAEQVEAMYRAHYADLAPRTKTIRNSFDPLIFDDPVYVPGQAAPEGGIRVASHTSGDGTRDEGDARRDLHIGFFGRFREMSPATLMIDVLSDLRRRHGSASGSVFVHSFGPLSAADAAYARSLGVEDLFVAHNAVPLQQSLSVLRRFDLLLVSTEPRRRHIIPAKLFEYLPAGRPILSLSRNSEVDGILRRTGTGIQMQDRRAVADLLASCLTALEKGEALPVPYKPDGGEIMKYDAASSTAELSRVCDELLASSGAGSSAG